MSVLIAVDLDQTLIYSQRSGDDPVTSVVVERLDGEPLSRMAAGAVELYRELAAAHLLVPVTTRTVAQYSRVALPAPAPYAICANGGVLLVDGAPDPGWSAWVRESLAVTAPLPEVLQRLSQVEHEPWVKLVRTAEELFAYVVAHRREDIPLDWLESLTEDLRPLGWQVSVQGRKAYAVPTGLSKATAVQRLMDLTGVSTLLAAGDSLLDRPLLELAATSGGAIRPAHGELHDVGWTGAHHTTRSGAAAAEEILRWLTAAAASTPPSGVDA